MAAETAGPIDLGAYRLLAEALPHPVWFARADGSVTFYNHRIERYGGPDPEPGGVYEWAPIVHPDDLEQTQQARRRAVEQRTEHPIDFRFLETNPQFEKATGIRDPVGRSALESSLER